MKKGTRKLMNLLQKRIVEGKRKRVRRFRKYTEKKTTSVSSFILQHPLLFYQALSKDPSKLLLLQHLCIQKKPEITEVIRRVCRSAQKGLGEFSEREKVEFFALMQEYQMGKVREKITAEIFFQAEKTTDDPLLSSLTIHAKNILCKLPSPLQKAIRAVLTKMELFINKSPVLFPYRKKKLYKECKKQVIDCVEHVDTTTDPISFLQTLHKKVGQTTENARVADTIERAVFFVIHTLKASKGTFVDPTARGQVEKILIAISLPIRQHLMGLAQALHFSDLVRADWANQLTIRFLQHLEEEMLQGAPFLHWKGRFHPIMSVILEELASSKQTIASIPNAKTHKVLVS